MTSAPASASPHPRLVRGRGGERRPAYDPQSLLDVAVAVFNQRGYDGTSMEDLARAAGISKSSIYHHVAGKEALLRTALDRALDALFAVCEEERSTTGPAIDRLRHVIHRSIEVLDQQLPYVTLLLRVRGNTKTEKAALERRRTFDRFVARLVAQAAADGDLRADLDPALATRLIFGMVNSISEWYHPGGEISAEQLADGVVNLVLGDPHPA